MAKQKRLLKDLRVRMWHAGMDPRAAWVSTSGIQCSSMEASYDGGLTWGCGDWYSTLGDFVVKLIEAGIWIDKVTLVDQRNGTSRRWEGQYEFTFHRVIPKEVIEKTVVEPEEPPYVAEGFSNSIQAWVSLAMQERGHVSEPGLSEDISPWGPDPVHEALARAGRPI